MKKLVTQSAVYKFSNNLLMEPGAFVAFKSFVFAFLDNNNLQDNLTFEEAEVANEKLTVYVSAACIFPFRIVIESISQNTQFNLRFTQFIGLNGLILCYVWGMLDVTLLIPGILIYYPWPTLRDYLFQSILGIHIEQQFEYYNVPQLAQRASQITYFTCVELLLAQFIMQCLLAAKTIKLTTPLHRAALANDVEKFRDLVRRGANLNARTNDNKRLINLLHPNSELISEFNLNSIENIEAMSESELLDCVNHTIDYSYAIISSIASNLYYYLQDIGVQFLNKCVFVNQGAGSFDELYAAVTHNDLSSVQDLLIKHGSELQSLTIQQQTLLFATANTIRMQAKLISMGVDFRYYMYDLYVERKTLNDMAMLSSNNQRRIVVLNMLLPQLDTSISNKIFSDPSLEVKLQDEFCCPITKDLPSMPVKIGTHRYDLSALMSAWGVKKINPITNVPCKVEELIFDLQAFQAINAMYPIATPAAYKDEQNNLNADIKTKTILFSYFGKNVARVLMSEYISVILDLYICITICLLINYVPLARKAIMLTEAYYNLLHATIALYVATRIRRNMQNKVFNENFLERCLKDIYIGIFFSGVLNNSTIKINSYNRSMYQIISVRETNNLNIEFLEHNMHKVEIIFAPDTAWVDPLLSVKNDQYLDDQYAYIFVCMLLAHSINFAIKFNNINCFTDWYTYDFHAVEPDIVITHQAKPITFWRDIIASRSNKDSVMVDQNSDNLRFRSLV